jgi:hypothetical protein
MQKRDVTKLPKWAQDRIAILERDLASAQEKLGAIGRGETLSRAALRVGIRYDDVPLASDRVRFLLNDECDWALPGIIDVQPNERRLPEPGETTVDGLDVSTTYGYLLIEPLASNRIVVRSVR